MELMRLKQFPKVPVLGLQDQDFEPRPTWLPVLFKPPHELP